MPDFGFLDDSLPDQTGFPRPTRRVPPPRKSPVMAVLLAATTAFALFVGVLAAISIFSHPRPKRVARDHDFAKKVANAPVAEGPPTAISGGGLWKVSKSKYDALVDGMSYAEAIKVIGSPGEEMSSVTLPGVPGVMEGVKTKMYAWKNWDGSNVIAMFQNDKLMSKSQFGLR